MEKTRSEQIKRLFARENFQALVCRAPQHLVMLTGYQSILGNSFCLVSLNKAQEIEVRLAIPVDEQDLIPKGAVIAVETFSEETMDTIATTLEAVRQPLGKLLHEAGIGEGTAVGIEGGCMPIIPAYTQVGVAGPTTYKLLHLLLPGARLRNANTLLDELAATKTEEEIASIRRCEAVACQGFAAARETIRKGATEAEVAAAASAAVVRSGYANPGSHHVQAHVHVMAGARAALAYRAFNLTSNAVIEQGDTVTVQMEVGVNGYWAELTRTFFASTISQAWHNAHQACVAAQDAALAQIRDGRSARDVDGAARQVMKQAGFGAAFKHGLGHGFGFQAINHAATPILHPASHALLRNGMVHNMEPAVYLEGLGGLRLNDNIVVRQDSAEVLSSALPRDLDWLVV